MNALATDAYKFSMAAAGYPLRTETFYYSHRRGGPHYLPFDVEAVVRGLLRAAGDLPEPAVNYLRDSGYAPGGACWAALTQQVSVSALPKGSWFFDREPAFSLTGPSALLSWLEPTLLQLNYRIQVATLALLDPDGLDAVAAAISCSDEADIFWETLEDTKVSWRPSLNVVPVDCPARVYERVRALADSLRDPGRMFEVGFRSTSCLAQHRVALAAAKEAGLRSTSNVFLARVLDMRPIGTMGHEHVQRFGSDDAAFRAMRERHPGASTFLLDTYSTTRSGLPAAIQLLAEDASRGDGIRFDSGDLVAQFALADALSKRSGVRLRYVFEDGLDLQKTKLLEQQRKELGVPPEDVSYGYGGHIVKAGPLTRDRVSAVWKLSQTGNEPTMKFGDAAGQGKVSIPGRPVLYRRPNGDGHVLQLGETPVAGLGLLPAADVPLTLEQAKANNPLVLSPETLQISSLLSNRRGHG